MNWIIHNPQPPILSGKVIPTEDPKFVRIVVKWNAPGCCGGSTESEWSATGRFEEIAEKYRIQFKRGLELKPEIDVEIPMPGDITHTINATEPGNFSRRI